MVGYIAKADTHGKSSKANLKNKSTQFKSHQVKRQARNENVVNFDKHFPKQDDEVTKKKKKLENRTFVEKTSGHFWNKESKILYPSCSLSKVYPRYSKQNYTAYVIYWTCPYEVQKKTSLFNH